MKKLIVILITVVVFGFSLTAVAQSNSESSLYLVIGYDGPGFTSPAEAAQVLEKGIIPTFNVLLQLEKEGKILAGGVPVGDRALMFIVQASSNDEVDKLLRNLPAWGALKWKVKPLESFEGRVNQERKVLENLKKMMK